MLSVKVFYSKQLKYPFKCQIIMISIISGKCESAISEWYIRMLYVFFSVSFKHFYHSFKSLTFIVVLLKLRGLVDKSEGIIKLKICWNWFQKIFWCEQRCFGFLVLFCISRWKTSEIKVCIHKLSPENKLMKSRYLFKLWACLLDQYCNGSHDWH